ncbi:MAG TPA: 5'-3' exonuclease H3TH domain-containing protein [Candidatus Eremiobacteraceae bacterium]|nr:5'-3' exonuclease H3TH domain-containing protein [Candidatus Eremiobacteraceae bacterium]
MRAERNERLDSADFGLTRVPAKPVPKKARPTIDVYLVDGTYELFRHFFAVPPSRDASGQEIGAVRGVVGSVLSMLESGNRYIGVATDHVIESFRNALYAGYKTGEGVDPELMSQFPILEEALDALGVLVWPMVEFEADDALAAAAVKSAEDDRVARVIICTPDKDLGQTVSGSRIVQMDRRRDTIRDEQGVIEKFGVKPESIPDYLGVVGDSADGFPGIAGWGAKAAAAVLSRYVHLEAVPKDWRQWDPSISRARALSESLTKSWDDALLFRHIATLRTDAPVFDSIDEMLWKGPKKTFEAVAERLKAPGMLERAARIRL